MAHYIIAILENGEIQKAEISIDNESSAYEVSCSFFENGNLENFAWRRDVLFGYSILCSCDEIFWSNDTALNPLGSLFSKYRTPIYGPVVLDITDSCGDSIGFDEQQVVFMMTYLENMKAKNKEELDSIIKEGSDKKAAKKKYYGLDYSTF